MHLISCMKSLPGQNTLVLISGNKRLSVHKAAKERASASCVMQLRVLSGMIRVTFQLFYRLL